MQFSTFEFLSRRLSAIGHLSEYRKTTDFLAGALAGCTAMSCAMPLDVIRTRLVAQGMNFPSHIFGHYIITAAFK